MQGLETLGCHTCRIIARLILGQQVYKLSGCGHVLKYAVNVSYYLGFALIPGQGYGFITEYNRIGIYADARYAVQQAAFGAVAQECPRCYVILSVAYIYFVRGGLHLYGVGAFHACAVSYEIVVYDLSACQIQDLYGASRSVTVEPGLAVHYVHVQDGDPECCGYLIGLCVNTVQAAVIIHCAVVEYAS